MTAARCIGSKSPWVPPQEFISSAPPCGWSGEVDPDRDVQADLLADGWPEAAALRFALGRCPKCRGGLEPIPRCVCGDLVTEHDLQDPGYCEHTASCGCQGYAEPKRETSGAEVNGPAGSPGAEHSPAGSWRASAPEHQAGAASRSADLQEDWRVIEAATRPIPSLPGYAADDQGRIWSVASNWRGYGPRPVTTHAGPDGYLRVRLKRNGRATTLAVHRLIAEAFQGRRPAGSQVRHLDGNRLNNAPGNLAYGTGTENAADRETHGRTARGSRNGAAKLTESQAQEIRRLLDSGLSQRQIARQFDVSQRTIWHIAHGIRWAHVSGVVPVPTEAQRTQAEIARLIEQVGRFRAEVDDLRTVELAAVALLRATGPGASWGEHEAAERVLRGLLAARGHELVEGAA